MTPDELSAVLEKSDRMTMLDPPSAEGSEVGVRRGKDQPAPNRENRYGYGGRNIPW
jgi:hypothetical protein